jgi:hypothetical protein
VARVQAPQNNTAIARACQTKPLKADIKSGMKLFAILCNLSEEMQSFSNQIIYSEGSSTGLIAYCTVFQA